MKPLTLAAAILALATLSAHAQIAAYGKLDYNHYNDSNSNTTKSLFGGGVGIYDDFFHAGPLSVGGDLRGDLDSGDSYSYRRLLLGARASVKVPVLHLKPYVQPLFGYGGAKYTGTTGRLSSGAPITTAYDNKFIYGIAAGVDLTILPHIDWRVIEIASTREKNGTLPNPNTMVSTGLVIRFF